MITKKHVFVVGYNGYYNFGDDAACVALVNFIRSRYDDVIIHIFDRCGYLDKNFNKSSELIFSSSLSDIFKSFALSKIIILNGGDHLHDYGKFSTTLKVHFFFLLFFIISKSLFKKIYIVNNGFRAKSSAERRFMRLILSFVNKISTRDNESYALLKSLSIKKIYYGFDSAILLNAPHNLLLNQERITIGISISPIYSLFFNKNDIDDCISSNFASQLDLVLQNRKIDICFLLLNTSEKNGDALIVNKIYRKMNASNLPQVKIIAYDGDCEHFIKRLSSLNYFICCKYHSAVIAYLLGKPMLIINCLPKNYAFAQEINLPDHAILSQNDLLSDQLYIKISNLIKNTPLYYGALQQNIAIKRAIYGMQCYND